MTEMWEKWAAWVTRAVAKSAQVLRDDGCLELIQRGRAKLAHALGVQHTPLSTSQYQAWARTQAPDRAELDLQRTAARDFAWQPRVSIVVPATTSDSITPAMTSVLEQTYPIWEVCLVTAVPPTIIHTDARITHQVLPSSRGVVDPVNAGLAMVRGDFVTFLDPDDELAPNFLFEAVQLLQEKPHTDIVYCDEDAIVNGHRCRPWFKPGWSPEMLLSVNYLAPALIRRQLAERVAPFDLALAGAHDWDFLLRCTELTKNIEHIAKIAYHRRQRVSSFAPAMQAVRSHLRRGGVDRADVVADGARLRALWPTREKLVSIIIPTRDKTPLLRKCLTSLWEHTDYPHIEVILVDTGSKEPATRAFYATLASDARVRIVEAKGAFNYSHANNLGARAARGEHLLFLNNDTETIHADWLEEMVRWGERPGVGVVGAKLLYPNRTIQHAGVIVGMRGNAGHLFAGADADHDGIFGAVDWYRNYLAVTGACMLVPRAVFEEAAGFDENYQLAYSDVEFCLRVRARGHRIVYTPFAELLHHEGKTRGNHVPAHDLQLALAHQKHYLAEGDPYFNPNLSRTTFVPKVKARS